MNDQKENIQFLSMDVKKQKKVPLLLPHGA